MPPKRIWITTMALYPWVSQLKTLFLGDFEGKWECSRLQHWNQWNFHQQNEIPWSYQWARNKILRVVNGYMLLAMPLNAYTMCKLYQSRLPTTRSSLLRSNEVDGEPSRPVKLHCHASRLFHLWILIQNHSQILIFSCISSPIMRQNATGASTTWSMFGGTASSGEALATIQLAVDDVQAIMQWPSEITASLESLLTWEKPIAIWPIPSRNHEGITLCTLQATNRLTWHQIFNTNLHQRPCRCPESILRLHGL